MARSLTGTILGIVALISAVLLTLGWWLRDDGIAEVGLFVAAFVWLDRMFYYGLTSPTAPGFGLSLAWSVGACGAWLLEMYDHRWQHIVPPNVRRKE